MTLVLSRKAGERVFVGGPAFLFPVEIQSGKVRLGIQAKPEHPVYRIEVIVDMLRSELKARSAIHKYGLDPVAFEFSDEETREHTDISSEMLEEIRRDMEDERFVLLYLKLLLPDTELTFQDLQEFLMNPVVTELLYRPEKEEPEKEIS